MGGIGAQNVLLHGAEDDGSEPQENGGQQFNPMEILALFGKGKSGKGKMPWSKGKTQPAMAGAADAKTSMNTVPGKGSTGIANGKGSKENKRTIRPSGMPEGNNGKGTTGKSIPEIARREERERL